MNQVQQGSHIMQPRGWQLLWRYSFLGAMALLFAVPLFWMLASSLKPEYQIFASPPVWWPSPPRWENYLEAFSVRPFGLYFANTLLIASSCIIGHLCSCSLVAYAFARLQAPGRNFWLGLMLSTLMLPYPVLMVPQFILFSKLGWVNTFWPLIVPAFFGNPFYIFLLRQFFLQIPAELEEAARLDGANTLQILVYVVWPLSRPALLTVTLFTFQATWNDFLPPLIFLQDQSLYTVMLGISSFRGAYEVSWAYIMATALVGALPVALLFLVAQRLFIEGVGFSGFKQ
jgi:ABC-type glycerol-3-phosphate transport system permease component